MAYRSPLVRRFRVWRRGAPRRRELRTRIRTYRRRARQGYLPRRDRRSLRGLIRSYGFDRLGRREAYWFERAASAKPRRR